MAWCIDRFRGFMINCRFVDLHRIFPRAPKTRRQNILRSLLYLSYYDYFVFFTYNLLFQYRVNWPNNSGEDITLLWFCTMEWRSNMCVRLLCPDRPVTPRVFTPSLIVPFIRSPTITFAPPKRASPAADDRVYKLAWTIWTITVILFYSDTPHNPLRNNIMSAKVSLVSYLSRHTILI